MATSPSPRPAKKSETLEVRMSYPLKQALVADCEAKGITLSDAVRALIEDQLTKPKRRPWFQIERIKPMLALVRSRPKAATGSGLATFAALTFGLVAPSAASDGRAVFTGLDANGDGLVARDEFVQSIVQEDYGLVVPDGVAAGQTISTGRLTSAAHVEFERYDTNHDNQVTFDEFSGRYLTRMRQAFAFLDEDRSGYLTASELSVSFGAVGAPTALALIEELDASGDGQLSYGEFIDATP